jgi:hypothetical protein
MNCLGVYCLLGGKHASAHHRQRRGAAACLGVDDFGAGVLDACHERLMLLRGQLVQHLRATVRQQRQDGDTGVAPDDWHVDL